jgi:hypothetical protein
MFLSPVENANTNVLTDQFWWHHEKCANILELYLVTLSLYGPYRMWSLFASLLSSIYAIFQTSVNFSPVTLPRHSFMHLSRLELTTVTRFSMDSPNVFCKFFSVFSTVPLSLFFSLTSITTSLRYSSIFTGFQLNIGSPSNCTYYIQSTSWLCSSLH